MSYSVSEPGVPWMLATGGTAGAAGFSGAAGAWLLPEAVTLTANAIRMAMRVQGVLENCLIWPSTQKKSDYGHSLASAPGGGSLASTGLSHQYLMRLSRAKKGVAAKQHD